MIKHPAQLVLVILCAIVFLAAMFCWGPRDGADAGGVELVFEMRFEPTLWSFWTHPTIRGVFAGFLFLTIGVRFLWRMHAVATPMERYLAWSVSIAGIYYFAEAMTGGFACI